MAGGVDVTGASRARRALGEPRDALQQTVEPAGRIVEIVTADDARAPTHARFGDHSVVDVSASLMFSLTHLWTT